MRAIDSQSLRRFRLVCGSALALALATSAPRPAAADGEKFMELRFNGLREMKRAWSNRFSRLKSAPSRLKTWATEGAMSPFAKAAAVGTVARVRGQYALGGLGFGLRRLLATPKHALSTLFARGREGEIGKRVHENSVAHLAAAEGALKHALSKSVLAMNYQEVQRYPVELEGLLQSVRQARAGLLQVTAEGVQGAGAKQIDDAFGLQPPKPSSGQGVNAPAPGTGAGEPLPVTPQAGEMSLEELLAAIENETQ